MLTGQAKKDYQRKYMKEYMRKRRAVGLNIGLNKPVTGLLTKERQVKGFNK